ncbi:hypothetical protein [Demequina activiva]|uniref:Uncharacterized protein n=1 Tax=Demequina activiva TaxID=1582364 RepID=A0A919UJM3_9MICO|nr:hypothetical protein [Demequina activiva]GIG53950.1 hypothetical protein Dac01nite_07020 [Demequina activiva]
MAHASGDDRKDGVLSTLAQGLERGADAFTPARDEDAPADLPGRRRGEHLAPAAAPSTVAAAVLIDCGTSRRDGFTHVLWVSPSVESVLGSAAAERIGEIVGSVDGITAYDWEGLDHLHVRAAGMDHTDVLRAARAAVEAHRAR